jgi:hypothetical protein
MRRHLTVEEASRAIGFLQTKTTFKYKLELFNTSEKIWSLAFFAEYILAVSYYGCRKLKETTTLS